MKKFLSLTIALILCLTSLVSCGGQSNDKDTATDTEAMRIIPKYSEIDRSKVETLDGVEVTDQMTDYVLIDVQDMGQILVRLYPEVAPKTVANFKKLVSESFYDGLIFHRVMKNFMIQCGGFTPDMKVGEYMDRRSKNGTAGYGTLWEIRVIPEGYQFPQLIGVFIRITSLCGFFSDLYFYRSFTGF